MAKICVVDQKKIGPMTASLIINGSYICAAHCKSAGFKSPAQALSYVNKIDLDDFKAAAISGTDYKSLIDNAENKRTEEIKAQFEAAGVSDLWGTKKEVRVLPELLDNDEIVKYATSGFYNGNTVLMVCTNQRILFIDKGMVYGMKSSEIPLDMVNSVNYDKGLLLGSISIVNGAVGTKIDNINKETAPKMVAAIKAARLEFMNKDQPVTITEQPKENMADKLRQLKSLLDDGILTQEEFDDKKKQILGI
jgi:hypothetical protein